MDKLTRVGCQVNILQNQMLVSYVQYNHCNSRWRFSVIPTYINKGFLSKPRRVANLSAICRLKNDIDELS